MKYMHFNSSCSLAALAMLLENEGINTEDTEIALELKLPWIFTKQNDCFCTGPMLQSKEWFDIFLNPRGLCLIEESVEKAQIPEYLKAHGMCMLGINLPDCKGKHAVVYYDFDGCYHFFNPIYEGSNQSAEIALREDTLLQDVDNVVVVGYLNKHAIVTHSLFELRDKSVAVLQENYKTIEEFCLSAHTEEEYLEAMDNIFRAILLDGVTMLKLAGEIDLSAKIEEVQRDYLTFMKGSKTGRLADSISLAALKEAIEEYVLLIRNNLMN